MINAHQLIVYLPLLGKLKYPANAAYINEYIRNLVFFDLIPIDWLDTLIYYIPEGESYNTSMQMFGFESALMVANAGIALWTIFFFMAILAIFGLTYKIRCCRRLLGNYLFWNRLVRLLAEVYLEMLMLSALNLRTVNWSAEFSFENYSNVMSLLIIMTLTASPMVMTYTYFK